MSIRWTNLIAALLLLTALGIGIRMHRQIGGFLETLRWLAEPGRRDERLIGLIAFGVVAVILLGALRLMLTRRR